MTIKSEWIQAAANRINGKIIKSPLQNPLSSPQQTTTSSLSSSNIYYLKQLKDQIIRI